MTPDDFNRPADKAGTALTDNELLDWAQRETLKYFTDFAHPNAGMARERSNVVSGYHYDLDCVTTGGTGFGIMAMVAGAERGWLPKDELRERVEKIVAFLEKADTFHGAFPHFLNANTGKVIPFSPKDDGGDLVETSFLMMGLMTARQYLQSDPAAASLRGRITKLYEDVEWDFYRNGQDKLFWHWSPKHGFGMNLPIEGWNECLVTHVLAAASPTHGVPPSVYEDSWTRGNDFINGMNYNGVTLPLGPNGGGPMFFAHYSFLGLNPKQLKDAHADYFAQNVAHARINYNHAVENPNGFKGYGPECWGLTACDSHEGYGAYSPTNDRGVIAPTAALGSFPYTPAESMAALRHFHDKLGDKIIGKYGFVDSFSEENNWVAKSNLAIDQGPIVVMIENYRSGLLWDMFMSAPEVKTGLDNLGFVNPAAPPQPKLQPKPANDAKPRNILQHKPKPPKAA